ncbi:MAG: AmmeMemoRadiSam system protein A [Deferrisomatales bacterium]
MLTPGERQELLRLARRSVEAAARRSRSPAPAPEAASLCRAGGAFVTLHRAGQLRGCIGTFETSEPLYRTVAEMARSAAMGDPRFAPVTPAEVPELDVEISVLSPLVRAERPEEVEVGRHGVYIIDGNYRGVLLPQVAVEHGWDRETFLDQTCRKAGLPPGAWRRGGTIYVFEAEVFGESDTG